MLKVCISGLFRILVKSPLCAMSVRISAREHERRSCSLLTYCRWHDILRYFFIRRHKKKILFIWAYFTVVKVVRKEKEHE